MESELRKLREDVTKLKFYFNLLADCVIDVDIYDSTSIKKHLKGMKDPIIKIDKFVKKLRVQDGQEDQEDAKGYQTAGEAGITAIEGRQEAG